MKRVFITGANGFLGQAITQEMLANGYQVIGLTRSQEGADLLEKLGATAHFGSLQDHASLLKGISQADGVIHTAFNHNFATFKQNCEDDRAVIKVLGKALHGADRPLIVTSGAFGKTDFSSDQIPRAASDEAALALHLAGINSMIVGLPQVHNQYKFGLVSLLLELAQQKGLSGYLKGSTNAWAAVHVSDAARLYRLVFESGKSGEKYLAIGEEGIPLQVIAKQIGERLGIPTKEMTEEEAEQHFAGLMYFVSLHLSISGEETKRVLNWQPTGSNLLDDLANAILS